MFRALHKVSLFDRHLLRSVGSVAFGILGIFSGILTFFDLQESKKVIILMVMILIILMVYFGSFIKANLMRRVRLYIDDSEIDIQEGNIFSEKIFDDPNVVKVFAFNEYFDTLVDNNVISENSLNGQFIKKKVVNVKQLDERMASDDFLSHYHVGDNEERASGKKAKYALGSIFKYSESVFLTALTHFNDKNEAYLSIQDYVRFLINFWDQVDSLYANRTVVITLFGLGITRLENHTFNNTQILQIILWTFYIRRIKFKKPAKFVILLDEDTNKNINYYKVKVGFNDLQK